MKRIILAFLFCSQLLAQVDFRGKFNQKMDLLEGTNLLIYSQKLIPESENSIRNTVLENEYLLSEHIIQTWNGSSFEDSWREVYSYDGRNNKIKLLFQNWEDTYWEDSWKNTYSYDNDNNLINKTNSDWGGMKWIFYDREKFTYDENNNMIEFIYKYWDGGWQNVMKDEYTYDDFNNKIECLCSNWENTDWIASCKIVYKYDENNNMIEHICQKWDGTVWKDNEKRTCIYDGNNNLTEDLHQKWNGTNWSNDTKDIYIYDGNNNLIEHESMLYSMLEYSEKYIYVYDNNNNIIEHFVQKLDNSNWIDNIKGTWIYDENNNLKEQLFQKWDGLNWTNHRNRLYSYLTITELEISNDENITYKLSNNYPNPFNPVTKIEYSIPKQAYVSLSVFDVLGNEITKLVKKEQPTGYYEIEFDASELSSGIYFYSLKTGDFIQTKKMILLR